MSVERLSFILFFISLPGLPHGCASGSILSHSVVRWNLFDLKYNDIYCGGEIRSNQEPRVASASSFVDGMKRKGVSLSC